MKNLILSLLMLANFGAAPLYARQKIIPKTSGEFLIYGELHVQALKYMQLGASIHLVNKNGHGVSYTLSSYSAPLSEPGTMPVCKTWIELYPHTGAMALVHELKYHCTFYQKGPRFRLNAEVGLNYGSYDKREYYLEYSQSTCFSSRWNTQKAFGISTRLVADFPIFYGTGFQLSINANLNSTQTIVGPAFTWTFGRVRSKF